MNSSTFLLRQINPAFVQLGRVTSQAFRPTPKDQHSLSAYHGDMIDAAAAWNHFTESLGLCSVGVQAITVSECVAVELSARRAPEEFPEHAVIDFSGHSKSLVERKAKQLTACASVRGWLYQA